MNKMSDDLPDENSLLNKFLSFLSSLITVSVNDINREHSLEKVSLLPVKVDSWSQVWPVWIRWLFWRKSTFFKLYSFDETAKIDHFTIITSFGLKTHHCFCVCAGIGPNVFRLLTIFDDAYLVGRWGATIAQWIRLHLSSRPLGSSPKHTIYAFY